MAFISPGVEVNVIDESFYTPAGAGTVPMIFVATAQDKTTYCSVYQHNNYRNNHQAEG